MYRSKEELAVVDGEDVVVALLGAEESCIEYAMKKETPSALISGAMRGAFRSGR